MPLFLFAAGFVCLALSLSGIWIIREADQKSLAERRDCALIGIGFIIAAAVFKYLFG